MRLALLLLAATWSVPGFAGEFPYQHGLVCERESGYSVDSQETSCARPIPGAQVSVQDSKGTVNRTTTNERGEFAFNQPFPMDGRGYAVQVAAYGNSALRLEGVETSPAARSADQVQVVFLLPLPASMNDVEGGPVLFCPGGVRFLLHSGVRADNNCAMRAGEKSCRSAADPSAYAMANCDQGCTNTGGPGFCCRLGTPGCELERPLRQVDPAATNTGS